MKTLVLASGNKGKLAELNALLNTLNIEVVPQSQFQVSDAIEDGLTFIENALIKARHASKATNLPALADDSGIEVDYLQGQPGIYSARFAGEPSNDLANNQKLLESLEGVPSAQRTARFHCVLALVRRWDDPTPLVCQASWEGEILTAPRGENGFGYDPLFWVPNQECSSAELPKELKNKISHRGQACAKLKAALPSHLSHWVAH
jgi:XTP/dITP diphosphohydrolase